MIDMGETKERIFKGGSFLTEDLGPEDILTPEDFTEEQRMIMKTTEDFVEKDVVPQLEELENQNFDVSVKLLKKAGELGLLGADVPEEYGGLGLDKTSSALITE